MAVRDLLWGCPVCRTPGGIRPDGRRERCISCGSSFRRGRGVVIVAERNGVRTEHTAPEWLGILGPVQAPEPSPDGLVLGPENVRVKLTRTQKPLHFGGELIGWVEVYEKAQDGTLTLRTDGLHFDSDRQGHVLWRPRDITGLQPASSSLQIGLHRHMASVKFIEGSVRLWTRAISDLLRTHYRSNGRDVLDLQPFVRTCPVVSGRAE